jgi:plastocyanin
VKKLLYWLALALPLLALAGIPASADTPPPVNATVIMTDSGFNPASVTIQPGGSVTWINQGSNVHTATAIGGAPITFTTGGLGPGQSTSLTLGIPGKYYYTSATDCQSGNVLTFPCAISFLINVTSASVEATSAAATAAAIPPTPTPTATPLPSTYAPPIANVYLTDTGVTPTNVTIALYGAVTFINQGNSVHSATSQGNTNWQGFDTGGLGHGQLMTIGFSQPGTFSFTSAPDCLFGNLNPAFACATGYTVTVSPLAIPGPSAQPTSLPTVAPTIAAPNPNPSITIDDNGGFTPNPITVKAGQFVTWTNKGTQVHTVTSNGNYTPAFDSGGMNTGQTFSVQFNTPGSFGYHSQTDVVQYFTDAGCGCIAPQYRFTGLINVSP